MFSVLILSVTLNLSIQNACFYFLVQHCYFIFIYIYLFIFTSEQQFLLLSKSQKVSLNSSPLVVLWRQQLVFFFISWPKLQKVLWNQKIHTDELQTALCTCSTGLKVVLSWSLWSLCRGLISLASSSVIKSLVRSLVGSQINSLACRRLNDSLYFQNRDLSWGNT